MGRGVGALPAAAKVCVQVAAGISAIGWGDLQSIVSADVARRAGHSGVRVGEREASRAVIKHSRSPGGNRVARRAGRSGDREPGRNVVRYVTANGCASCERRLVAAVAVRRIQRVVVGHMASNASRRRRGHVRSG